VLCIYVHWWFVFMCTYLFYVVCVLPMYGVFFVYVNVVSTLVWT